MNERTPAEKSLAARIAGLTAQARRSPEQRRAVALAGVDGRMRRYLERVDPGLPHDERMQRAEALRRADMARMSLAAARARRARKRSADRPTGTEAA